MSVVDRKSAKRPNYPTGVPSHGSKVGVVEQASLASTADDEDTTDGLPVMPGEGWGALAQNAFGWSDMT